MNYLVYAYLQTGRTREAAEVVDESKQVPVADARDFKAGYASTVMPIRLAVEQQQWATAAATVIPDAASPQVAAVAMWARGLGLARSVHADQAGAEVERLRTIEAQLRSGDDDYWAVQARILGLEVSAWIAQAGSNYDRAAALMRRAADTEDTVEKLPVTPGPVLPAREQLGYLLLAQNQPKLACHEFRIALSDSPGRLGAIQGFAKTAQPRSSK